MFHVAKLYGRSGAGCAALLAVFRSSRLLCMCGLYGAPLVARFIELVP